MWFGLCDTTQSVSPLCRISQHLQASVHTHMSGNCWDTFAPVPSPKLPGVLEALCDHRLWPHYPRDPAGDCQRCHGASLAVALTVTCVHNSDELSASTGCSSGLRISVGDVDSGSDGWRICEVELCLTHLAVCVFVFTGSALVLLFCVVSCSQTSWAETRAPLPQPSPSVREMPVFPTNFPNVGNEQLPAVSIFLKRFQNSFFSSSNYYGYCYHVTGHIRQSFKDSSFIVRNIDHPKCVETKWWYNSRICHNLEYQRSYFPKKKCNLENPDRIYRGYAVREIHLSLSLYSCNLSPWRPCISGPR